MPFYLSDSTWRVLGLSVAASYTGLGLFEVVLPHRAAAVFFGLPAPASKQLSTPTGGKFKEEVSEEVSIFLPLLGVRDISIATAMFAFAYQGKWQEVGTVILAGTILCAADCVVAWKRMGPGL